MIAVPGFERLDMECLLRLEDPQDSVVKGHLIIHQFSRRNVSGGL